MFIREKQGFLLRDLHFHLQPPILITLNVSNACQPGTSPLMTSVLNDHNCFLLLLLLLLLLFADSPHTSPWGLVIELLQCLCYNIPPVHFASVAGEPAYWACAQVRILVVTKHLLVEFQLSTLVGRGSNPRQLGGSQPFPMGEWIEQRE